MIHKICSFCGLVGHKPDMVSVTVGITSVWGNSYDTQWQHKECYKKSHNVEECPCGNGYVKKEGK
jgi:hypothetical protein